MTRIRLVARRELMEAFRSRAYWLTMAIVVLGVTSAVTLPQLLTARAEYTLGVAGEPPGGLEADLVRLAEAIDAGIEVLELEDRARAVAAVDGGDVDAALVFGPTGAELVHRTRTSDALVALASQAASTASSRDHLVALGIAPGDIDDALAPRLPRLVAVDDEHAGRGTVAYVISLLLYLALFIGGMGVATGVAVEKSSRVSELLVTILRPSEVLAGKVAGIGASTALILVGAAVPFVGAAASGLIDVPSATLVDVAGAMGWFVLGYVLYATGFATMGALVDRQEDLGAAVAPFSAALVLSLVASVQAQGAPSSVAARITSIFPLSAPVVMPTRIAAGAANPLEVIAAVAVGMVSCALLVRVGGAAYQRALLRGGRRLRLREVLRA